MISSDSASLVFRARADVSSAQKGFDDLKKSADKSVSGIDSAFSGAGRGFGQLESRIQSIAGGMKSFGDGIQNLGKSLTAALTVPLAALATLGTKSAISLDDLRNKLISATGSVEAANQKFAELKKLSDESAGVLVKFAADTFAFLKPMNLATETIDKFTKALGRIKLTDSGLDTEEFSRNLTQLFKQNFELQDLKQLVGRFPRAAELIAEQFGLKSSDLGTLQETLQQMKEQGKLTFEGFINGFAEAVENDEALGKLTDTAGTRIAKAMERISFSLAPLGSAILDTIEPFIPPLIALIERISEAFNSLSPTVKTIIVAFGALAAALGPVLIVVGSAVGAIGSLVSGLLALTGAATVGAALAALAPILLKVAAVAALAGAALAAIAGTSAVLYAAWQRDFGGIQTFTLAAWERIKQIISAATEFITRTVGAAVNSLVTFWRDNYSQIEGAVKTVSENIKRIFSAFFSAVQSFWETHGERIKAVVVAVWNFIRDLIGGVIKQIGNFIKLGLQVINGDWAGAWQTFLKIVQQAVTIVVGYIKNMGGLVLSALSAVIPIVAQWSLRFQAAIVKGVAAAVAAVVEAIRTLPQKIIEILPQLIPKLKEVGGQIGQALIDGIYAAFSNKPIVVPVVTQQDFIQGGISGTLDAGKIIEEQARESEKARKEREKLNERSVAAQIELLKSQLADAEKLYDETFNRLQEKLKETGDVSGFKEGASKLQSIFITEIEAILPRLEQLEKASDAAAKKIKEELDVTAKLQADRRKSVDDRTAKAQEDQTKAIADAQKKAAEEQKKISKELIDAEIEAARQKVSLREATERRLLAQLEEQLAKRAITEEQYLQRRNAIHASFDEELIAQQIKAGKDIDKAILSGLTAPLEGLESTLQKRKQALESELAAVEKLTDAKEREKEVARVKAEIEILNEEILAEYYNQRKARTDQNTKNLEKEKELLSELLELRRQTIEAERDILAFRAEQSRKVLVNTVDSSFGKDRIAALKALKQFDLDSATRAAILRAKDLEASKAAELEKIEEKIKAEKKKSQIETDALIKLNEQKLAIEKVYQDRALLSEEEFQAKLKAIREGIDPQIKTAETEDKAGSFLTGIIGGLGTSIEEMQKPVDILKTIGGQLAATFHQVASAVGDAVKNFVLFGSAGGSFQKFAAEVIASIAQMSVVQALWEFAQGVAMSALGWFTGNPKFFKSATDHFIAAGVFAAIGGVAAGIGRGVAGNSFQQGNQAVSGQTSGGFGSGAQRGEGGEIYTTNRDKQVIDLARNQSQTIPERPIYVQIDSKGGIPFDEFFALRVSSNGKTRDVIKKFAQ